ALRPEGYAPDIALGDVEEANDFRTRVERALQAPPSFEGVSLLRGFQGQQHREVQPIRPHRIRQGRQPTGFSDPGLSLRQACRLVRALALRDSLLQGLDCLALTLGRLLGSDVSIMAGLVCPQRQPSGSDGEHTRDESGGEEAEAELFLTLGRHLGVFCSFPLRLASGLGGFTQAALVLQFILLALPFGLLASGEEVCLDGAKLVAVRRGSLPGAHPSRDSRPWTRDGPSPTLGRPRSAGAGYASPHARFRSTGGAASSPGSEPRERLRQRRRSRRRPRS